MTEEELKAIETRAEAATPGPWGWEANAQTKHVEMCSYMPGLMRGTVLDVERLGNRVILRFRFARGLMQDALDFRHPHKGREHHARWSQAIDHPDANFIAAARADVPALIAAVRERDADNAALREELAQVRRAYHALSVEQADLEARLAVRADEQVLAEGVD